MAKKVAMLLGQGFEDSEFKVPFDRLKAEGFDVDIIGREAGEELKGDKGKVKHTEVSPKLETEARRGCAPSRIHGRAWLLR